MAHPHVNIAATVTDIVGNQFLSVPDDLTSCTSALDQGVWAPLWGVNCRRQIGDKGFLSYSGGPSRKLWNFHDKPLTTAG